MKKRIAMILLTAVVIGIILWIASIIFSFSYQKWSFIVGLGITIVLLFFNTSGGALSKMATFEASESSWKVQKEEKLKVNVGIIFFGSLLYTIFSFILMYFAYF